MDTEQPAPANRTASRARARREREIAERRATILAAARDIFFERGLYRATVDEIAERAEIAKGTVYLYFSSKETILAHVLIEGLSQLSEEIARAIAGANDQPPDVRVRLISEAYLNFFETHPQYLEMMMASDRGNFRDSVDPTSYEQVLEHSLQGFHHLVSVIEEGMHAGDFVAGNAESQAAMIWSAVNGVLVLYAHPLRREMLSDDVRTLYTGVLDLVLKGLHQSTP